MCGLAGLVQRVPQNREATLALLTRQADTMVPRGPDGQGTWVSEDGTCGLAHRRLAIQDLSSAGYQPMVSHSGRFVMAFNGEVYNTSSLRAMVGPHRWAGHSDTEVLLAGFDRMGVVETLKRADAMFAIALWDHERKTLTLARDRFGEKPLCYGFAGDDIVFGSTFDALRAHPRTSRTLNPDAIAALMRWKCVPAPLGILSDTFKVPPGHLVTVSTAIAPFGAATRAGAEQVAGADGAAALLARPRPELVAEVARWDDPAAAFEHATTDTSPSEAVERFGELLVSSVQRRLVSDRPIGAFLSGGVDSTAVVTAATLAGAQGIATFTIGSDSSDFDESDAAASTARQLGTIHTCEVVTAADCLATIPRLATVWDEPFADTSQIPTLLVSEVARREVVVALSGDGGDELFGGYNRYTWISGLQKRLGRLPRSALTALGSALAAPQPRHWAAAAGTMPESMRPRLIGQKVAKVANLLSGFPADRWEYEVLAHWPTSLVKRPLSASFQQYLDHPGGCAHYDAPTNLQLRLTGTPGVGSIGWLEGFGSPDVRRRMAARDIHGYLPDDILTKVDRAAMAHSLETRVPFLEPALCNFAASLPSEVLWRDGRGKWPVREWLKGHLDPSAIDAPKSGFGLPIGDWLRADLRPWAETLLEKERFAQHGMIDRGPVLEAWRAHQSCEVDRSVDLWDVLMLHQWLDHHCELTAP